MNGIKNEKSGESIKKAIDNFFVFDSLFKVPEPSTISQISTTSTKATPTKTTPAKTKEIKKVEIEKLKPVTKKATTPNLSEGQKYLEEVENILSQRSKEREPHLQKISDTYQQISNAMNTYIENLKTLTKEAEKLYSKKADIVTEKLPSPPTKEEVTQPKNLVSAIVKNIVPLVIGIVTFLKPGKYGEMYYTFNSMMKGIEEQDDKKFSEALQKWQLQYEQAKEEKLNRLSALDTLLQSLQLKINAGQVEYQTLANTLQTQLSLEMEVIKEIDKSYEQIIKSLGTAHNLNLQEKKVGLEAQKVKLLGQKIFQSVGELNNKLVKNVWTNLIKIRGKGGIITAKDVKGIFEDFGKVVSDSRAEEIANLLNTIKPDSDLLNLLETNKTSELFSNIES